MPSFCNVRRTGKCDFSTMRMISSFSDAGISFWLAPIPDHAFLSTRFSCARSATSSFMSMKLPVTVVCLLSRRCWIYNASRVLNGILEQEKAADQSLIVLAKERIDYAASEAVGDDEALQELTKAFKNSLASRPSLRNGMRPSYPLITPSGTSHDLKPIISGLRLDCFNQF